MKNVLICFVSCLLLAGCFPCENCDDYHCADIGEIEYTFDGSELAARVYDGEFNPDSVPRTEFGLKLETFFKETINRVGDENNIYFCSDHLIPDTLVALNFYVKTIDTTYNVNSALRTDNVPSSWLVEDIDLWSLHFWGWQTTNLQVVNWNVIPDTTAFVSELTFSSGLLHANETEMLIFK